MPSCPHCEHPVVTRDGYDRHGRQRFTCTDCGRDFTLRSASAFSGYRWPADVILMAVRWYLRHPLSSTSVMELLAERGIDVSNRTVLRWVQAFGPQLAQQLVPLGEKVFVLLAETVPIVFDPGAIRLSQLSQQVDDELALGGKLAAEIAYFVFGIERPFPPRRFFLGRSLLDPALSSGLRPCLRLGDDRIGCVVRIGERARYPGELGDAAPGPRQGILEGVVKLGGYRR